MTGADPAVTPADPQAATTTLPTSRVEAFSDAVIAVAATLLVLELREPGADDDIWGFLGDQFPSLAAYVVSFLTILIFWVNHHALFDTVARVSRGMLFVNGLLLLAVSFVSYSTAVLGHALQTGHHARSAAVLYAVVLGLASACFTALWVGLRRTPTLLRASARPRVDAAVRRSLTGPAGYAVAALVALVSPPVSLALTAAVAGYFALRPRHLTRGVRG